jgi:hypothetical protein
MNDMFRSLLRLFSPRPAQASSMRGAADLEDVSDLHPTPTAERVRQRALRRQYFERILVEHPNHPTIERIVDNRVFLLGLDAMYRERMKRHESTELLACARAVAERLHVPPADVPIEGYYGETRKLTEYFRLMRGLQSVRREEAPRVAPMREYQRLLSVASAPIYGRPFHEKLLPLGRGSLTQALEAIDGDLSQLTVDNIVERAHRIALETEDFSLVDLAAFARDAVMLTALRESVVLYELVGTLGRERLQPVPVYVWQVDEELARRGGRFVVTFNELFGDDLPEPVAENADLFFDVADENKIVGRCVCIGKTPLPERFYHWAIRRAAHGRLEIDAFWDSEVWTTDRYSLERVD